MTPEQNDLNYTAWRYRRLYVSMTEKPDQAAALLAAELPDPKIQEAEHWLALPEPYTSLSTALHVIAEAYGVAVAGLPGPERDKHSIKAPDKLRHAIWRHVTFRRIILRVKQLQLHGVPHTGKKIDKKRHDLMDLYAAVEGGCSNPKMPGWRLL